MQAIILAAGFGQRLAPVTEDLPKALVEVNGHPLLVNALNLLSEFDIDEAIIVVGHLREKIIQRIGTVYKGMRITYVDNPRYRETNNVYSFYLTKDYIRDDVIMLECDLFFDKPLLEKVVRGEGDCSILVSPYNRATMDGTVIRTDGDKAKALIIKKHQIKDFDYSGYMKTVNVYKFKKDFMLNHFLPAVSTYVQYESVNSYYELVLGSLIYYGNSDIRVVMIEEDAWAEIDNAEDLARAEKKFKR
jgi:choline kinase